MNDTHFYEGNLTWSTATQGTLSSVVIISKIGIAVQQFNK